MTAPTGPAPRGRPSAFTEAIAEEVCERLAKGEPLAVMCRDDHMPTDRTVHNWTRERPEFLSAFADARARGFDALAAECLEIAEDGANDYRMVKKADGSEAYGFDNEHVQRSKLRIETRLKLLAKWDPKRYGDKMAVVGGGPDDSPLQQNITVEFVPTDRDRAKAVAQLVAKAKGEPSAS